MAENMIETADVVALAEHDGALHVLVVLRRWNPFEGRWALPGGHVDPGETPVDAAVRELAEETGVQVDAADLRHLGRWDAPGRDPRGRYATTAYLALLPELVPPTASDDAKDARWTRIRGQAADIGALAFDHQRIVAAAVRAAGGVR